MASRREQAGLPTYPGLRWVTLQAMREMALPASNDEINAALADALRLDNGQRAVMHVNGRQTEVAYRVAWVRTALRVAGAVDRVGRALWTLTPEGREISAETISQRYSAHLALRAAQRTDKAPADTLAQSLPPTLEDVDDGAPEPDWQEDLLKRLRGMSSAAFEHLAAALLRVAGFDDVEVTGRSGDGGIDGIGVYRPSGLISFRTAFQCKRYQGSVGGAAVREFRGSFAGRSDRGIVLTTGSFTSSALAEAARDGVGPIDLIDGETLCDLLREFKLGVTVTERVVEDVAIDDAYFERLER